MKPMSRSMANILIVYLILQRKANLFKYLKFVALSLALAIIAFEAESKASSISNGYGDFVFFSRKPSGQIERVELTPKMCENVYAVLSSNTIQSLADSNL